MVLMFMLGLQTKKRKPERQNMPRTSPTVDGSGNFKMVTFKYIDAHGESRSDRYKIAQTATDAQIEAVVAALGAASNGNLYRVEVLEIYNANKLKSAAVDAEKASVHDNIVMLFKDTAGNSRDFFLPSPLDATLVTGTTNPDAASVELAAVLAAIDAMVEAAFAAISVRFTERREKNSSVAL